MHSISIITFVAFGFLVLAHLPAAAHSALVSCFGNKDGTITCEAGYSDGAPSKGQIVRVLTATKRLLKESRFGNDGTYTHVIQRAGWGTSKRHDLMEKLNPIKWRGMDGGDEAAYRATLPAKEVRSMGDYVFVLEPVPYLEKTEDIYIQQFTKTVVNVGGVPGNWHEDVGLPAEIRPLDRPYANWVGGVFRGAVLSNGNPAPGAEIEVQYVNHKPDPASNGWKGKPAITVLHPSYESMSIRADAQGNFTVGLPKAGWWGIAALGVGPQKEFQGKSLSQDAVLWIEARDMK